MLEKIDKALEECGTNVKEFMEILNEYKEMQELITKINEKQNRSVEEILSIIIKHSVWKYYFINYTSKITEDKLIIKYK